MKQYRNILLSFGFIVICSALQAQNKKDLTISAGAGWIKTPDNYRSKAGANYIVDFDYSLTNKSALWFGFLTGNQRYLDTLSQDGITYIYEDGTNADISYYNFSLGYKYRFFSRNKFSAAAGVGAALSVVNNTRPFVTRNSSGPMSSAYLDLVFPMRLEVDYKLTQHFKAGLYGGTSIQPDYPFVGNHVGIRIGYILR